MCAKRKSANVVRSAPNEVEPSSEPIVQWSLDRLKPHPRQLDFFEPLIGPEKQALTDDMRRRGMRVPIEALRDGTIVTGHSRVDAARELGWTTISVKIIDGLHSDDHVMRTLLLDNLHRRQLSPLNRIRAWKAFAILEKPDATPGEIVSLVTGKFSVSRKTVLRNLAVLNLPRFFQRLFDEGRLGYRQIAALLRLSQERLAVVETEVQAGEDIRKLLPRTYRRTSRGPVITRLLQAVASAEQALTDAQPDWSPTPEQRHTLTAGANFLRRLAKAGNLRRGARSVE